MEYNLEDKAKVKAMNMNMNMNTIIEYAVSIHLTTVPAILNLSSQHAVQMPLTGY